MKFTPVYSERHVLQSLLRPGIFSGTRRQGGDIAREELRKILEKEVLSGLHDVFGASGGRRDARTPPYVPEYPGAGRGERNVFDERLLEFRIDELVASSLLHGRQTSGVLRTLFGLVPGLIGR